MKETIEQKHKNMLNEKQLFIQYFNIDHNLSFTPKYLLDGKLIDIKDLPTTLFNYQLLKNSKMGESELLEEELKKYEITKWNKPCKAKLFEVLILLSFFKQHHVTSKQKIIDLENGHCDHLSFDNQGTENFILGKCALHGIVSDIKIIPDIVICKNSKSDMFQSEGVLKMIECKATENIDENMLHNYLGKKIDLKVKDLTIITCCKVLDRIIPAASKLGIRIIVFPLYDQSFVQALLGDNIISIDTKLKDAISICG
jgi:hypothetical protein